MKKVIVAVALLLGATARAAEPCQSQKNAADKAKARVDECAKALAEYESAPLAPLTEEGDGESFQGSKEWQQLKSNLEAAMTDARRNREAYEACLARKKCKKWKGGWKCIAAGTYEECCLDKDKKK